MDGNLSILHYFLLLFILVYLTQIKKRAVSRPTLTCFADSDKTNSLQQEILL